jgi:hypothetical protein
MVGLSFYKSIFANYLNFFFHDNLITRVPSFCSEDEDEDEEDDDWSDLTSGATSNIDEAADSVAGCNCSSMS